MHQHATTLAEILARPRLPGRGADDVDEPQVKLVVFTLDEQWYAFHGEAIGEVLADSEVYFLPGCPPSMEGVINVRGDIESVIRLRTVLGLPDADTPPTSRILLAKTGTMRSGLRVDRVEDVTDVAQSAIQPPPHTLPEHLRTRVLGIVMYADHAVHLLDPATLFAEYCAGPD